MSVAFTAADIEIALSSNGAGACQVRVVASMDDRANGAPVLAGPVDLMLDHAALRHHEADPLKYGALLGEALFAHADVYTVFAQARAAAQLAQCMLYVRLWIQPDAAALAAVFWETLVVPGSEHPLALEPQVSITRYVTRPDWTPLPAALPHTIRPLVVIANPAGLEDVGYAPVDVAAERELADRSLRGLRTVYLTDGRATVDGIAEAVAAGSNLVYLICHGHAGRLALADAAGRLLWVHSSELAAKIEARNHDVRLVVLAACQTAGHGASWTTGTDRRGDPAATAFVQAGVPAVLAMQGLVAVESAQAFMPLFWRSLRAGGAADHALAAARTALAEQGEWWVPTLTTRMRRAQIYAARRPSRLPRFAAVVMTVLLLVAGLSWLGVPPFRHVPIWSAVHTFPPDWSWRRSPDALHRTLYNSGTALLAGKSNLDSGCLQADKGLWVKRAVDAQWRQSEVGDLLCIDQWGDTSTLSDIRAIDSDPQDPDHVFVLASHSGLLESRDGGATFGPHRGNAAILSLSGASNWANLMEVVASDSVWVAGGEHGLWHFDGVEWHRVDGAQSGGIPLGAMVTALLGNDTTLLVGTRRAGLWTSADGGASWREVFAEASRHTFDDLHWIDVDTGSFLALVTDEYVSAGTVRGRRLLMAFCLRDGACDTDEWRPEEIALPSHDMNVVDLFVQPDAALLGKWYAVTDFGGVILTGDIKSGDARSLPRMGRCLLGCASAFAAADAPNAPPYLLAERRLYRLDEGPWWQRIWP